MLSGTKHVTDVKTLQAITHPLRTRLLTLLRLDGPATATELARRTGESSGATSYHLRQLARFGYVEEDGPQTGRERRWRAATRSTTWESADFADDPEGRAVSDTLERRQLQHTVDRFGAWMRNRERMDPVWRRVADFGDDVIRLTPSQARGLSEALYDVLHRFRTDPPPPEPGEPTAYVATYLYSFPFERVEDLDP